jgi:hypothetical protein
MSLINDALKKAARQRAEDEADVGLLMPGSQRRASRQSEPMKTQTMIVIAVGALALAIVSAVVTGMMMSSKPDVKEAARPAAAPAPSAAPAAKVSVPPPTVAVTLAPKPVLPTPAPTSVVTATPAQAAAPQPAAAPVTQPEAAPAKGSAISIQNVVDGYHVSGARAAGAESKALIDGHVYRLNDTVDRALGIRLTNVEEDRLTFSDRDGNTYTKPY